MKKIMSVSIIVLVLSSLVYAKEKKTSAAQPTSKVKTAFGNKFPEAKNVTWEKENGLYEANFKQQGKEMSALFDEGGNCTETETEIATKELPESVKQYVSQHYAGQKINEAAKIVHANGDVTYEAEVRGKDVMFDANGKFLKEEKD